MSQETVARVRGLVDRGAADAAIELAVDALRGLDGPPRAELLLALGAALASRGRMVEAMRRAVEASELFRTAGDPAGLSDALSQIASTLRMAGDHASALQTLEQAEALAHQAGDALRLGRVLRQIGISSSLLGRHQHALSCLQESETVLAAHAPPEERRFVHLSTLNARNRRLDTLPEHERLLEAEALLDAWGALARTATAAGQTRLELMARGNHAITLQPCGRQREAIAELQALLPRYRDAGMRPNEGLCHGELGRCHESLGEPEAACAHYRAGVEILREGGAQDDLVAALDGLSRCEEARGRLAEALAALRELRETERRRSDDAARQAIHQRELRIELARLTDQWARDATRDALTGLANRRALGDWLDEHWPRVEHGEPLVLLLLDLDHFKRVNDTHGHDTGDAVLVAVAQLLRTHARAGDLAVRYGGEEFVLALAGARRADAEAAAERLRAAIAGHDWPALAAGLAVTTSIGLADAAEVLDAPAMLTLADRRLYAAKYGGRDRVVTHG